MFDYIKIHEKDWDVNLIVDNSNNALTYHIYFSMLYMNNTNIITMNMLR